MSSCSFIKLVQNSNRKILYERLVEPDDIENHDIFAHLKRASFYRPVHLSEKDVTFFISKKLCELMTVHALKDKNVLIKPTDAIEPERSFNNIVIEELP